MPSSIQTSPPAMHRRSLHPNRIYPAINGLDLGLSLYLWVKFRRLMIIAAALSLGFAVLIFLLSLSARLG